jgi:hypothetical protein
MLLTLEDFLTHEPESIHWDEDLLPSTLSISDATKETTVPNNSQVEVLKVKSWQSFVDHVKHFISNPPLSLVSAVSKGSLPQDEDSRRYRVETKGQLSQRLLVYICVPTERLFASQDPDILFDSPGRNCLLMPDYGIFLKSSKAPKYALKSIVEVKTPWAFPSVPGGDLAATFCQLQEGSNYQDLSSVATNVICAVNQLWGYMAVNHFRYGVLTTYLDTYFFRRVEVDGQSWLEISPAVRNKGGVVNIIGAWAFFISLLGQDPIYSTPYSTPQRVIEQELQDKYVPLAIALGDLDIEQKLSFGATGNVVLGRPRVKTSKSTFDDKVQYAIKLIDSTKVVDAKKIFCKEIEAYKRLESLQGKVIPTFKGAFVASNFVFVIVLENCGSWASQKELSAHSELLNEYFKEIHQLGVVQGDVARRNIQSLQGHLYVIDFGFCQFKEEDYDNFDKLCNEEMEQVSELLIQE